MSVLKPVDYDEYKKVVPKFREGAEKFFNHQMNMKEYKGFSGKYGSYAQRGGQKSMLRLRMSGGRVTPEKLRFIVEMIRKHDVKMAHFTTCQTIQLHDLDVDTVCDIMEQAPNVGIVCYGGGGDYPRNVMCSPLSGVEEEYFDVMPHALAAAEFLLDFIDQDKMPRKLKVAFSNSKSNVTHATFRDLGFVAREDGRYDVYIAGGLGNNPKFGVKVKESLEPGKFLYVIEAMIRLFRKYGNYENRSKARTRYLQESLGRDRLIEEFDKEFRKLKEEKNLYVDNFEDLRIHKEGEGEPLEESFIVKHQTNGDLYSVLFHPRGGVPSIETLGRLSGALEHMDQVEMRLSPDEGAYIINLTANEARQILEIIESEAARTAFETSESCIGASICQVGLRDSQDLLRTILAKVSEAGVADDALPQIHISGCPSSCAAHQIGKIGFRGALKVVDKKPVPTFLLYAGGNDEQGEEKMGVELGNIPVDRIPDFLIHLARIVEASGMGYDAWEKANPDGVKEAAADYLI